MTMERCLVLGATGFIGRHLCRSLTSQGHCVRALSRRSLDSWDHLSDQRLDQMVGDYQDRGVLDSALEGIDVVYHLISATTPTASNRDPSADVQSNVLGTLQLLEAARVQQVRKIVFVSSGGTVYGVQSRTPIPESATTEPISAYGIGKLAIEKYLNLYHRLHGLDYCVLRVANPFGELQPISGGQGVVGIFLHKALRRQPIEIWGSDQTVRDFIYIKDVVAALLRVKDHNGPQKVFNIGSGEGRSLRDLIEAIEVLLGHPVVRRVIAGAPADVPVNVLDISLARSVLDWQPRVSFLDGLRRTNTWVQQLLPTGIQKAAG
jgi:UDP-glucose 4-epimerase